MDGLKPSFRGFSESFKQGYAGTKKCLVKPKVPAADGFEYSVDTQFVCYKPVMPSFHGVFTWTILCVGVIRMNDLIQNAGDNFCRIVFELHQKIRKHTVDLPASGVITPASGDPKPFRVPTFMPEDTSAVIPVTQMTFITGRANIITALS